MLGRKPKPPGSWWLPQARARNEVGASRSHGHAPRLTRAPTAAPAPNSAWRPRLMHHRSRLTPPKWADLEVVRQARAGGCAVARPKRRSVVRDATVACVGRGRCRRRLSCHATNCTEPMRTCCHRHRTAVQVAEDTSWLPCARKCHAATSTTGMGSFLDGVRHPTVQLTHLLVRWCVLPGVGV